VVTNLPLKAKLKWAQVVEARDPREKIRLMQEFLSLCPKHKGTEKLLSQVKRRISQLKEEVERSESRRKGSRKGFFIEKSGAAQVVLLGPTKVGRSSLLRAVTNAKPPVGEHPFMTKEPTPGMLPYQDIQFQIIEAPAIVRGAADGKGGGAQILGLARNADGLIIMVDLSEDSVAQYELVSSELERAQILRQRLQGEVEVEKRVYGAGIQFIWEGSLADCTTAQIVDLLREYRITSALVRVWGKVTLDMVEDALYGSAIYKPTLVLANKADLPGAEEAYRRLREAIPDLEVLAVSCIEPEGLVDLLGGALFRLLGIIRIYTKELGKEPSKIPFVAGEGATVEDLAKMIHSDFLKNFNYARIWGPNAKFQGGRIGLGYVLRDGDIIEIHT
jgi:hypothetical protein